jgi:hypothetical protein
MKKILIWIVAVIVVAAAGLYTFREPLQEVAIERMTANMFVSRDSDAYDPGPAVGQPFPAILARFEDREVTGVGSFMGTRGMVVYAVRSVDW